MKKGLTALKLYILGLVFALFILGWSLVARDEELKSAQPDALPYRLDIDTQTPALGLPGLPDLPPIPSLPRIRTRSS